MTKCVDCDICNFRTLTCLCEISENEDDCPLANLSEFSDCVVGLTFDKTPILSYKRIVMSVAMENNSNIRDAKEIVDYNYIPILENYKTKPIIMYEL